MLCLGFILVLVWLNFTRIIKIVSPLELRCRVGDKVQNTIAFLCWVLLKI
jgi:hypothetical protein